MRVFSFGRDLRVRPRQGQGRPASTRGV